MLHWLTNLRNHTGIDTLGYPKDEFYAQFDPEEVKRAQELGLPLNCSNCEETKTDPSEITVEKFFKMQKLSLDID